MSLKLVYRISDFAKLLGMSQKGAREWLQRVGVPMHLLGKCYYIYSCDLQENFPKLYNSLMLMEMAHLNNRTD